MSSENFKVIVYDVTNNVPDDNSLKRVVKAEHSQTLRSLIRQTIEKEWPLYEFDDDDISCVLTHCETNFTDMLDSTIQDLIGFCEESPYKTLNITIERNVESASAAVTNSASSWDTSDLFVSSKSKTRGKKRKERVGNEGGLLEKKSKTSGADDVEAVLDTGNDAALAAAIEAVEEKAEFWGYSEGGDTYEARVIDWARMGKRKGALKFRVEWRRKVEHEIAATSLAPSSSAAAPPSDSSEPLCTSWVPLKEFIVPSAALAYVEASGMAQWDVDGLKKDIEEHVTRLKEDNNHQKHENEPLSCREVDFCCFLCQCGNRNVWNSVTKCSEISKYHRGCCHGLKDDAKMDSFRSSLARAQERNFTEQSKWAEKQFQNSRQNEKKFQNSRQNEKKSPLSDSCSESDPDLSTNSSHSDQLFSKAALAKERALTESVRGMEHIKARFLKSRSDSARSRESKVDNDLALPAPDSVRWTDNKAVIVHKDFNRIRCERIENPTLKRRAVILDVFAGIGGAEICLKRLGIEMTRVIVVEWDRVAQHVFRTNHDPSYGEAPDDGIEYIFGLYETFEELEESLKSLVEKHGPIDLVVGAPPCQEHSKVNAYRKGVNSKTGRYMRDFAKLISKVRHYNKKLHSFDESFFLAENVPGSENATHMYGVAEYQCDALLFGPCYRNRIFYFNWEPDPIPDDEHPAGGSSCFDDGWMMPTMYQKGIDAKAMTLLASKRRTKDVTLYKWKVLPGTSTKPGADRPASHGEFELFDTNDRERLMGLPMGYVDIPVQELFYHLRRGLTAGWDLSEWRNTVPPKYWNFLCLGPSGYNFGIDERFEDVNDFERIALQLKEWNQKQDAKVFMKSYEYAWHLIGNGFSIPQVEYLFRPLQDVFKRKNYPGYTDTKFAWEDDDKNGGIESGAVPEKEDVNSGSKRRA